jgi:hypothetical protein
MDLCTREADAAFADLICTDSQWLRAEFDALIAASFDEPPAPPPPAPPRIPPRPGIPRLPSRRPAPGPAASPSPATGPEDGRPRSPPAHLPSWASPRQLPGGPHDRHQRGHRPGRPGKEELSKPSSRASGIGRGLPLTGEPRRLGSRRFTRNGGDR